MKKIGLSAIVAIPFMANAAFAADLTRPATLAPPPVFTWTGFYAGINGGYDWADAKFRMVPFGLWNTAADANEAPFIAAQGSPTLHPNGFTGGAQIGFNWQSGNIVYGIEADANYTDLNLSRLTGVITSPLPAPQANFTFNETAKSNFLATIRPRIGVAMDRALFYVTGGLAIANYSFTSGYVYNPSPGLVSNASRSSTLTGWTLGAGVEYAVTNHWTVKAEYLYANLGRAPSIQSAESGGIPGAATYSIRSSSTLAENIIRVGLNYKF